jgi:hypothetical protein
LLSDRYPSRLEGGQTAGQRPRATTLVIARGLSRGIQGDLVTDQWTDTEKDAYFAPDGADEFTTDNDAYAFPPDDSEDDDRTTNYESLFEAPDYATFIKHEQTARGKEYEEKVKSMLKGISLAAFRNGNVVDGATILHYGSTFAKAAGDLTDTSDGAAKAIDLLTMPDNAWVAFLTVGVPFAMQFFRNHEREAEVIGKTWKQRRQERKRMKEEGLTPPKDRGTPVTIGRGRFKFTVRMHVPSPAAILNVFRSQTHDPRQLANDILSDEKLRKALAKQGIVIKVQRG